MDLRTSDLLFSLLLSRSVYIFFTRFVTLTYVAARIPRMRVYLFSRANDAYATKNAIAFPFSPLVIPSEKYFALSRGCNKNQRSREKVFRKKFP